MEVKMGVYWVALEVQINQKYVGKTTQNRWKTKRRARKPEKHKQTPDRGGHWLWCPVVSLNAAFWLLGASPWAAGFCLCWGILGLFASFF